MAILISYKDALGVAHWPDCNVNSSKYYGIDWNTWLTAESDTITAITWTVPTGLVSIDERDAAGVAEIKLRADTVGEYSVTCAIDTIDGTDTQKAIQVIKLKVV